ncbi:MAG: outer membrane lipoprotein-sorting protein [Trueperaceae bacterium]|nr:MAG: outer membrane lipoprotein-sorting protein [Trueperaceae bacterium]
MNVYSIVRTLSIVSVLSGLGTVFAQDFVEMLRTIDQRSNFAADFAATFTMERIDPEAGEDNRTVQVFRRDEDDAFLLLIQKPETQLGQGYLRIEDGLWFYDPESRQFTFTSLSEAFEGSDARNDDFGRSSLADDYQIVETREGTLGRFEVWIIELEALNDEVPYPFKTLSITKEGALLLKSEDYSLTKRLLRTSFFPSYARVGDNLIADQRIFVDALVENKRTSFTISNISTTDLPDSVFTKAYVERVNR